MPKQLLYGQSRTGPTRKQKSPSSAVKPEVFMCNCVEVFTSGSPADCDVSKPVQYGVGGTSVRLPYVWTTKYLKPTEVRIQTTVKHKHSLLRTSKLDVPVLSTLYICSMQTPRLCFSQSGHGLVEFSQTVRIYSTVDADSAGRQHKPDGAQQPRSPWTSTRCRRLCHAAGCISVHIASHRYLARELDPLSRNETNLT